MGFQVGQTVRHAKFGVGRVRAVETGVDPKLRVEFPGVGDKVIVARASCSRPEGRAVLGRSPPRPA